MKFIILHGTFEQPKDNWFPWLEQQIVKLGHEVIIPKFPTPQNQNLSSWKEAFDVQVGGLNSETFLIGHSTGAIFIPNLLNDTSQKIAGSFLVAGFWGDIGHKEIDPLNHSFCERKLDWEKVRNNSKVMKLYSSDNDPYVPFDKTQKLADLLKIEITVVPNARHFEADDGYLEFPLLLADLKKLIVL